MLLQEMRNVGNGSESIIMLKNEINSLSGSVESVGNAFKKNLEVRLDTQNLIQAVSAITQLGFAINSFKNIGEVINNDDLTSLDKFGQIAFNVSMTLPMLLTSIKGLKTGLTEIGKAVSLGNDA